MNWSIYSTLGTVYVYVYVYVGKETCCMIGATSSNEENEGRDGEIWYCREVKVVGR